MKNFLAVSFYRLLELLDGERLKGFKILPYAIAQGLKMKALEHIA